MRRAITALLLATLVAAGARARAEETAEPTEEARQRARELNESAERQYNLGRFEEALREYEAAYELFPAPGFLFNLGQCHRQLGHHERSIFFFEGYLRQRPEAANRLLVEELIAESRQVLEREAAARRAEEERARAEAELERAEAERIRAEEERRRAAEEEAARRAMTPPWYATWWFWSVVGVVVVGAVAGGVAYWAVTSDAGTVLPSGTLGTVDRR